MGRLSLIFQGARYLCDLLVTCCVPSLRHVHRPFARYANSTPSCLAQLLTLSMLHIFLLFGPFPYLIAFSQRFCYVLSSYLSKNGMDFDVSGQISDMYIIIGLIVVLSILDLALIAICLYHHNESLPSYHCLNVRLPNTPMLRYLKYIFWCRILSSKTNLH